MVFEATKNLRPTTVNRAFPLDLVRTFPPLCGGKGRPVGIDGTLSSELSPRLKAGHDSEIVPP